MTRALRNLAAQMPAGHVAQLGAAAALAWAPTAGAASPALVLTDDQGRTVSLPAPARRAVTLAPHATELAWAAGAGRYIVATVSASNWPPPARDLPRVGDGLQPDPERIAAYRPDLVIGWKTGRLDPAASALARLGVPLYVSAPERLADIPAAVRAYGRLFGTGDAARPAAEQLQRRLDALAGKARPGAPIRVFVQAGTQPLYTLNGEHIVSDALRLCGAVNVFADLPAPAPQIGMESVIAAQPEAIVTASIPTAPADASGRYETPDPAAEWRDAGLPAALAGHVYALDPDLLYRPGPRLIDAAEHLCAVLDEIRAQR